MPKRQEVIANSIEWSIVHSDEKKRIFIHDIPNYFYIHWLTFQCVREDLFQDLRKAWQIKMEDYYASFGGKDEKRKNGLKSMGDMGYSGSTFYVTADSAYLVKSVPRHFEHSFFKHDMLVPYVGYMEQNPSSLLVRITDFLECVQHSLGTLFGTAPSHHIVMENILYGQDQDLPDENDEDEAKKWQSWDLKPMSYFYPERDVAGGALSSEATKSKLADDFNEKIILDLDQAEAFKAQLEKDTALLEKCNAVDYSLFLVRIPTSTAPAPDDQPPLSTSKSGTQPIPPAEPPFVPPGSPSWRTGVRSADGKFVYRASILDFFWAKHKVHAKAMTGLIKSYNLIDRQGPMSVTTTAPEYRERFLGMCGEIVEVREREDEVRN